MIDKIIFPYVKKQMKSLGLRKNEERLLIADVIKGQWRPAIKKELADLNGKMVTVPSNMANHFQTLDLTVNRSGKARQLESGKQPENVKIDTRLSVIKHLHVKWIISFYDYMQNNRQVVVGKNQALQKF